MDVDLSAGIWAQPLRWPTDQKLSNGYWLETFVFFATAVDRLAPYAPADVERRAWASEMLIQARLDGILATMLTSSAGYCDDLPAHLWRAPELAAEYVENCGTLLDSGDRLWLFVSGAGLDSLVARAADLRPRGRVKMAKRDEQEEQARTQLEDLASAIGDDVSKSFKRDDWISDSGLGTSAGLRVWNEVAAKFPILSDRSKPRGKRTA